MIKRFEHYKNKKIYTFFNSLFQHMRSDDISALASKMTFFILLSIFPFFIFLFEILKHTTLQTTILLSEVNEFFPIEIVNFIRTILLDIQKSKTSTGLISVAVILYLWSASKGILAIIQGLNRSYRIKETRGTFVLRCLSVLYTGALAVLLLITFALVIFGNNILSYIDEKIFLPFSIEIVIYGIKTLFSLVFGFFFFTLLYNSTPNKKISFREASPGAFFSTIGWILSSYGFSYYIQRSNSISVMYGSLSGVIALMLWLYIICNIILIGGEINAILFIDFNKNNIWPAE